jgi:hypothetical protein
LPEKVKFVCCPFLASPAPSITNLENVQIVLLQLLNIIAAMSFLVDSILKLVDYMPLFLVMTSVIVLVFWRPSVNLDPAEPRLLRPKIPYIGHAIGFLRHQTKYLAILKYLLLSSKCLVRV